MFWSQNKHFEVHFAFQDEANVIFNVPSQLHLQLTYTSICFPNIFLKTAGSIRTHKEHKSATDKEIEMIAGKWFTDSRDRQGERKSRKKQTQAGQASQVVVDEIEENEEIEEN